MNEDIVEVDDGSSLGVPILEREAKLRGEDIAGVQIVEPGNVVAATTDDDGDDPDDEEPVEAPNAPDPTPSLPDPGDFVPADYSFEVQVFDAEGKNARTHKIKSVEQWDELLDGDPNLGSASALLKAQRAATKMETGNDRDQRDHEAKKAQYTNEKTQIEAQKTATNTMIAEIGYLQGQGKLPAVDPKYVNADWSDPEVAKQPGVKEQLALLNYMRSENKKLSAAGLPQMTSIRDAFNSFQLDRAEKGAPARRQQAGQQRKAAGARVASTSSSALAGGAPAGVSVGRGGSLRDLARYGY